MRFVLLILLFQFVLTTSVWAEECKPLSSEAVSSPLAVMCKDKKGKTSESLEERVFFTYALEKRLENMKCGGILIAKLMADSKYSGLKDYLLKDTHDKAVIVKKLKAERMNVVRQLNKLQPSLQRDLINELDQKKTELSAMIEATYNSMYQGSTQHARDFADQLVAADLKDPKTFSEQSSQFMRMLTKIDKDMQTQNDLLKNYKGTENVSRNFPDELKRGLTKDLEIRSDFIAEYAKDSSETFADNLTCRLDQKYGYAKEISEGRRDGVLNLASMMIPIGTGWALSRQVALAGVKSARYAGWARAGSVVTAGTMAALANSSSLGRNCGEISRDYQVSKCSEDNVMDFAIESIRRQNCFFVSISVAAHMAGPVIPEILQMRNSRFFGPRISMWTKDGYETVRSSSMASLGDDIQSKIWNLQLAGKTAVAESLENKTRQILEHGEIISYRSVGEGVSGAKFVRYKNGTEGVWKPAEGTVANANAEVAVEIVDKHLGSKMVPLTVEKELNGVKGTVQLRVTNATDEALKDYPLEMGLFDYLIGNYDRHGLNYLFTKEGRVVAIDHGRAFVGPKFNFKGTVAKDIEAHQGIVNMRIEVAEKLKNLEAGKSSGLDGIFTSKKALEEKLKTLQKMESESRTVLVNKVNAMIGDPAVVQKLRQTKPEDWQRLLKDRLSKDQIKELIYRQKDILESIEMAEKYLGKDIYRSGPTSPLLFRGKNGVSDDLKPQ